MDKKRITNRFFNFQKRFNTLTKINTKFTEKFDKSMEGTWALTEKTNTLAQELENMYKAYSKEKIRKFNRLLTQSTAYINYRTKLYDEFTSLQVYITDFYNSCKKHIESFKDNKDIIHLKIALDSIGKLEKIYLKEIKRRQGDIRIKLKVVLEKHKTVQELYDQVIN